MRIKIPLYNETVIFVFGGEVNNLNIGSADIFFDTLNTPVCFVDKDRRIIARNENGVITRYEEPEKLEDFLQRSSDEYSEQLDRYLEEIDDWLSGRIELARILLLS